MLFVKSKYDRVNYIIFQIQWSVIWNYVKAGGLKAFTFTILSHTLFIAAQVITNIWLSNWTNDPIVNGTRDDGMVDYRLAVYGGLGVLQGNVIVN